MNRVEAVVCHWKRPDNIPVVLEALRAQTVPVTCSIVDASYTPEMSEGFDRVFRVPNMGGWNRIAVSAAYDHDYTLFIDDDVLPSPRMVECFLATADNLNDRFACLGFRGRRYKWGKIEIIDFSPVNEWCEWLAQVYFLKTRDLHWVPAERHRCGLSLGLNPSNHFDAIMCYGITRATGQPCYVIPQPEGMDWDSLPDNDAISKNEGFERNLISVIERLKA